MQGFVPGQTYELRLQARTLAGLPARICMWESGPDRCARIPEMRLSGSVWESYRATITPERGTTGMSLFLYADAARTAATGPTITEYRDLALRPGPPLAVSVLPAQGPPAPDAQWRRTGPGSFAVAVPDSTHAFVLSIPESAAEGWRIDGLPADRIVRPVVVDGYAQGWLIRPGPAFGARLSYGPNRLLVAGARGVSAAAAVGAGLLAVRRRRRVPAPPQRSEALGEPDEGSEPGSAARTSAPVPWGMPWW